MKRGPKRVYLTLSVSARCEDCAWAHAIVGDRVVSAKDVATFGVTVNAHSKRHEHDVHVTIVRTFPGKRS